MTPRSHALATALLTGMALARNGRRDLLELDARRRIYRVVRRFPGLHLREIARNLGMEVNHAKYHLLYMERHGLVSSRREDSYWRFWPREEGSIGWRENVSAEEKTRLALLRRPVPLHVVLLLADKTRMNHSELKEAVGVSHSTLHYHMRRLEDAGLVVSKRRGRERRYRLHHPGKVVDLLVRYRPPAALMSGFIEDWSRLGLD